jgi:predicted transcriptional regulator
MKSAASRPGSVDSIDTLLAIKVIGLAEGLTANDRRVAVSLIEHLRRRDGRCDPGLNRIASLLGISVRTVIRCVNRLEAAGFVRKVRHGGLGNRNSYHPNWVRFGELEEIWRKKLKRKHSSSATGVSPDDGQSCHVPNDNGVTQTCGVNLPQQTYVGSLPSGVMSKRSGTDVSGAIGGGWSSQGVAHIEAERRWSSDLHREFSPLVVTYGEIIGAMNVDIQTAATDAELRKRGAGIEYIRKKLQLGGHRRVR